MKKISKISSVIVCLFGKQYACKRAIMVGKMAETVMTIWKDSLFSAPGRPAKWTYDQGVILKGIEGLWYKTGDAKYFNYMQKAWIFL
jgi:unsaturated rhamnogalacturonyl hydrolase